VRRKARERALQFLFGLDFTSYAWQDGIARFWEIEPARPGVKQYAQTVIGGVCENREALDQAIAGALQNWAPERVGRVERNILRIALYEMRHVPDVPAAVAINEAIELAKSYGAEDAPRFVNGVLDRLREQNSEQGHDPQRG
jgi:N utilization substance protein B